MQIAKDEPAKIIAKPTTEKEVEKEVKETKETEETIAEKKPTIDTRTRATNG